MQQVTQLDAGGARSSASPEFVWSGHRSGGPALGGGSNRSISFGMPGALRTRGAVRPGLDHPRTHLMNTVRPWSIWGDGAARSEGEGRCRTAIDGEGGAGAPTKGDTSAHR